MDMDKRYCQNRERKRKRTIVPSPEKLKNISSAEEERQFKLRRFVEDVSVFLTEKESCPDQNIISERKTATQPPRAVKKVNIPNPKLRGLYQNGIQTKLYTRGVPGLTTREMAARLDENMHRIISLSNNNQCNRQCPCTQHCKGKSRPGSPVQELEPQGLPVHVPLITRSSTSCEDVHLTPSSHSVEAREEQVTASSGGHKSLSELDKELYPLFTRVVSVSCTQTKSALFKNQSYVSDVKRKLLEIYVNGMKENKRERSSLPEPQRATSSVGTSPLPSSSRTQHSLHDSRDPPFKLWPSRCRFKTTMEFLEETIGPSSTSSNKQMIPSPSHPQLCFQSHQPQQRLLSPPVVRYQRPKWDTMHIPKVTKNFHEPFVPSSPPFSPLNNFRSKVYDGGGDGLHFNWCNSFLPPIEEEEEEDSPDFRYYPRRIF